MNLISLLYESACIKECCEKLKASSADKEALALASDGVDLFVQLGLLVLQDRNCDHVSGGSTGSAQSLLGLHEHIGDVLNRMGHTFSSQRMGR